MIESENEQLLRRIDAAENNLRNLRELVGPLVRRSWRAKFQPKLWQFVQYEPREVKEVSAAFVESPLPLHAQRIGIVTPSCNYAAFLGDTIMSVVNQSYPNALLCGAGQQLNRWHRRTPHGHRV